MCIFAQPVLDVTNTRIFARLQPDGWQHLVYQMNFQSTQKNAIILPLPVRQGATEAETLNFLSLEGYGNFFEDMSNGFPLAPALGLDSPARSIQKSEWKKLKVHEVGDFIASFVPTLSDFDRLDEQFQVPQESWDKIPVYADYGFAVFQLKSLEGQPHPMAFKFKSRLSKQGKGSIFFPTIHIHDGQVHAQEEFDHALYLQSPEFDAACGDYQEGLNLVTDQTTGYVRSKWTAEHFCDIEKSKGVIAADGLVHHLEMKGRMKNTDVITDLNVSHASFQFRPSPFLSIAAATCASGMAGLKWFCNRRDQVATSE